MKSGRVTATIFLLAMSGLTAQAADRWEHLGKMRVSDRTDRDVLKVGIKKGRFEAIRFRVTGRAVQFHDLKVYFENGDIQDVKVRSIVRAGAHSRTIDLEGGKRAIEKIVFVYDAQTRRRHKGSQVTVFGKH